MRFAWSPHTHPDVWALCAVLMGAYALALRLRARTAPTERPATRAQITFFSAGVFSILVAAEWPIHDLAERSLYSVHMVQHLILTLAVPPLLLLGTPAWLARALLPSRAMSVVRALSRPVIALVIFNATIVFTHWPTIVDASVGSEGWHFLLHTTLVTTAMLMWMPVFSPVIEIPRLSYPGQMIYLFLQSLVPTVPASFLTFGSHPLYHVYEHFARPWRISALGDQRTAGVIMKLAGGAILWGVITRIFFRWFRLEHAGVDALGFRDVDRTLNRMELSER